MKATKEQSEPITGAINPIREKTPTELWYEDIAAGRIISFEMDSEEALKAFGLTKVPDRAKYLAQLENLKV